MNQDQKKREELLLELNGEFKRYKRYARFANAFSGFVLLCITVAGFFTTLAGAENSGESVAVISNNSLIVWGLISAIGSVIIQNYKPQERANSFEDKKDAVRAIRTALNYGQIAVEDAARYLMKARNEPKEMLTDLAAMQIVMSSSSSKKNLPLKDNKEDKVEIQNQ